MRIALMFVLGLALAARTTPALGQAPPALELDWRAPEACPQAQALTQRVAGKLGPDFTPTETLRASGRITASPQGFVLELRTERGERRLEASSCEELGRSAVLILALSIDPRSERAAEPAPLPQPKPARGAAPAASATPVQAPPKAAGPAAPTRSPAPAPTPAPTMPAPTADAPPESSPRSTPATSPEAVAAEEPAAPIEILGFARAEILADVGMLSQIAAGPGLAVGLMLASTAFELSAALLPVNSLAYPDDVEGSTPAGALAQLSAFALRAGVCQRFSRGTELGGCLHMEYLNLTADPDDALERSQRESASVWTLLAAARILVPIGNSFGFLLELSAGLPVHGARFRVEPFGVVHETGTLVGRMRTGFELRF